MDKLQINEILHTAGFTSAIACNSFYKTTYAVTTTKGEELMIKNFNKLGRWRQHRIHKSRQFYQQMQHQNTQFHIFRVHFTDTAMISYRQYPHLQGGEVMDQLPQRATQIIYNFQQQVITLRGLWVTFFNWVIDYPTVRIFMNIHLHIRRIGFFRYARIYFVLLQNLFYCGGTNKLTHGDMRGNVLVDLNDDFYIYDFEGVNYNPYFMLDVVTAAINIRDGTVNFTLINEFIQLVQTDDTYNLTYLRNHILIGRLYYLTSRLKSAKYQPYIHNTLALLDLALDKQKFHAYLDKHLVG